MKYTFHDLKNKVVIITGGSGFLGQQFAKSFSNVKSKVIILDVIPPKKIFKNINYIECDITNEEYVNEALEKIKKKFKKIDVLINNASKNYSPKKDINFSKLNFENFTEQMWDDDINVGLKGSFLCTKIFGNYMAKKTGGAIVNISSDLGIISPDQRIYNSQNFKKPITYSVIKHGLIGLTKYTATYWPKKIKCNAIAPGGIYNNQPKEFVKKVEKLIPLGRMAKKNEYNFLVLFLASNNSSYLNGTTIIADGGRSVW